MTVNKTKVEMIYAAGGIVWLVKEGKRKILVVHRARYGGEWILPKGVLEKKPETNDDWLQAAKRAVREKTGIAEEDLDTGEGDVAGNLQYVAEGIPKLVFIYNMSLKDEKALQKKTDRKAGAEIDEVRLTSVKEALKLLRYPQEQFLLKTSIEKAELQKRDAPGIESRVAPGTPCSALFSESLKTAQKTKRDYLEKLETAKERDDIFKYLVIFDTSSLEEYVTQTRIQAEESFKISKRVAIVGFALIAAGIILGIGTSVAGTSSLDAAYLASLAGILTEFISGVFFYLYNRTLQQMNTFHDKLLASKKVALDYLATALEKNK